MSSQILRRVVAAGALAAAIALGACATTGTTTTAASPAVAAAQVNEKAAIEANLLYAAIGVSVNGYETLASTSAGQKAEAEAVRAKAWTDLGLARAAYAIGQAVSLIALQQDNLQAQASTHAAAMGTVAVTAPQVGTASTGNELLDVLQLVEGAAPQLFALGLDAEAAATSSNQAQLDSLLSQATAAANAVQPSAAGG